ncbi:MAG: DNA primase small subunit PriS [Haloarculaceae archaeon]
MDERTRAYLRGRFGDHYRRTDVTPPPAPEAREWGYVPWTSGPGETMVRHRALMDLGDPEGFLERERPKHVYFSAGRYDEPGAATMAGKGWRDSDLIFDLDADHLPSVDLGADSYAQMLAKCKDALFRLLDFLEEDFAFEDLTVVFSGGRGYHVHVRDESIRSLESAGRREIVDYVRGIGLDHDALVRTGMRGTATARQLRTEGGWGRRVHDRLLEEVARLREMDEEAAVTTLQDLEGVGQSRAGTIYGAVQGNPAAFEAGNLEAGGVGMRELVKTLVGEVETAHQAPIDEPVTTDTNRLIRLPGSIHGGSGLAVIRLERDAIEAFDPLVDAVPETFVGQDIAIDLEEGETVDLAGDTFTLDAGDRSVPEYLGVFLMCRGRAAKGAE